MPDGYIFGSYLIATAPEPNSSLLAALKELPDRDRLEIAITLLDDLPPTAMSNEEILAEASQRQDELESGQVQSISYDELVAGLSYRLDGTRK